MSRRGENIRKRKDGRWEGRIITGYHDDGKAIYKSVYGKTYMETKEKMQQIQNNQEPDKAGNRVTFEAAAEEWISYKQCSLAESSIFKYKLLMEKHIYPEIGGMFIHEITSAVTADLLEKKASVKKLSNSTLQGILYVIQAVCGFFATQRNMPEVKITVKIPHKPTQEAFVLSEKEQKLLEACLLSGMNQSKLGILICLYTGLRLGEICAMKWENISLEKASIRVNKSLQRLYTGMEEQKSILILSDPKSVCSMRSIPIYSVLHDVIKKFQSENACIKDHYILSGQRDKPMEPRAYEYHFQKYLKQSGIPHYKFHSLRHTFATNCIHAGVDVKSLSEILGHSSVSITLQKYVHSSFEMKQEQLEKLCSIRGQNSGQRMEIPDI